jgi:hypothetical protein
MKISTQSPPPHFPHSLARMDARKIRVILDFSLFLSLYQEKERKTTNSTEIEIN